MKGWKRVTLHRSFIGNSSCYLPLKTMLLIEIFFLISTEREKTVTIIKTFPFWFCPREVLVSHVCLCGLWTRNSQGCSHDTEMYNLHVIWLSAAAWLFFLQQRLNSTMCALRTEFRERDEDRNIDLFSHWHLKLKMYEARIHKWKKCAQTQTQL